MTDDKSKRITVTLTARAPIRVWKNDWPLIASASWEDWQGEYVFQAPRKWHAWIRVRQHQDGRALVYARYTFDSQYQGERSQCYSDGDLLGAGHDLAAAIQRVLARLLERGADQRIRDMGAECIADLPPVEVL